MVEDLIGLPFMGGGRDPEVGLDCYGLAMEVYRRYGYDLPEYLNGWNNTDKCNEFYKKSKQSGGWREIEEPSTPCLIAFSFNVPRGIVNHVGIYLGDGRFIHTRQKIGCCIENINSPVWRKMIEGYYERKTNDSK